MCGIAGVFHYGESGRQVDQDLLVKMTRALVHRGPDDEGFYVDRGIGLGHRRLSIVDLSPTGAQPMTNERKNHWITYNGEFYNHTDFRDYLNAKGHQFRGRSDTETLLHLLEEDGPDALLKVMGIFAFGYWEGDKRRLTLARDHLGVKQVYYHDDGKRIVFASEIKALLVRPDVPRQIDCEGVNQYLHFHTPLFDRTMFGDIRQLRPGEYLQITPNGIRQNYYWKLGVRDHSEMPVQKRIEEMRGLLTRVVGQQLMSDVPVGSFYSGGIDSSVVTGFALRNGYRPRCFGVHFSGTDVIDERPFQEAGAKALGVDLDLITIDGARLPEELMRLIYSQDEPVIGPAMFSMNQVSALAGRYSKVCLGGQAGDEIFGGYARYALAYPHRIVKYWLQGKFQRKPPAANAAGPTQGNLWHQLREKRTMQRLMRHAASTFNWRESYFENFVDVSPSAWRSVLGHESLFDREASWQTFSDIIDRSPFKDRADKLMHWDVQTYLPGLFHQDDRMSMAASLETRVPLADPRIVEFAFNTPYDLKFYAGSSKWILRQTISDVLPSWIINRRKVGFDIPVGRWFRELHSGFLRDLLLSDRARTRGMWNPAGVEAALRDTGSTHWLTVVWKMVCLEAWAVTFLDTRPQSPDEEPAPAILSEESPLSSGKIPSGSEGRSLSTLLNTVRHEFRNEGVGAIAKRALWESKVHSGRTMEIADKLAREVLSDARLATAEFRRTALFTDARTVADAMASRLTQSEMEAVHRLALASTRGHIEIFSSRTVDFGIPVVWNRNPDTTRRWKASSKWHRLLPSLDESGDIKMAWEVGRFPHAYIMARSAAFAPERAGELSEAFYAQVQLFLEDNPFGYGVHWASGQEIVFRLIAWLFALEVFTSLGFDNAELRNQLKTHLVECGAYLEAHIAYSRDFVYNNHLISEAVGLCLPYFILGNVGQFEKWYRLGMSILETETDRQVYPDGGYIQQSHNYHRVAMQMFMVASSMVTEMGGAVPHQWNAAMERSLDFLLAQQNPADGSLPNYGANDGALPLKLNSCGFGDFRGTLQAMSVATRGVRLYEAGPWDETALWLLGTNGLTASLEPPAHTSRSFKNSGYHVLRGRNAENFSFLRCGTVLERFSQIDMLHLDVWWKGQNVLLDPGTYLYSGDPQWHEHFMSGMSHNTVTVDGEDQMLHLRRFKVGPLTRAKLLEFEDNEQFALCVGEHYGFLRLKDPCTHRRSVLFCKDDVWVVVDTIYASGEHTSRLHWAAGPFSYREEQGSVALETSQGDFYLTVLNGHGQPCELDVVAGQVDPPRGWLSRYYAEKIPAPSIAALQHGRGTMTFVSVLAPQIPEVRVERDGWLIGLSDRTIQFEISGHGVLQNYRLSNSFTSV